MTEQEQYELLAELKDTVIGVTYTDQEIDYTNVLIPLSSICYISYYTQEIKWKERWDTLSKDKKDDCIAAFDKWYSKSHQEK